MACSTLCCVQYFALFVSAHIGVCVTFGFASYRFALLRVAFCGFDPLYVSVIPLCALYCFVLAFHGWVSLVALVFPPICYCG